MCHCNSFAIVLFDSLVKIRSIPVNFRNGEKQKARNLSKSGSLVHPGGLFSNHFIEDLKKLVRLQEILTPPNY